jgi:hypothetical protein
LLPPQPALANNAKPIKLLKCDTIVALFQSCLIVLWSVYILLGL